MEPLIILSIISASIASLTGIFAVGSGRHWKFKAMDYFRGKRNAVVYLWVICSSVFSIFHAGLLSEYALRFDWAFRYPDQWPWLALHAVIGMLLTFAHLFVAHTLSKEVGPVDKFIWGKRRRASV